MCNERERLIDYLYGEGDPADRAEVQAHLARCEACRREVAALREVRDDLLAWEVPDHGSVWQPFAPPEARPSWRDVPAWTMAAAAAVVLVAGMAGGAAAGRWMAPTPAVAAPVPVPAGAALTEADLADLASTLRAELAVEMETRLAEQAELLTRDYEAVLARVDSVQHQEVPALGRRLDETTEFMRKQASWAAEIEDRTMRTWNALGGSGSSALRSGIVPVNYGAPGQ